MTTVHCPKCQATSTVGEDANGFVGICKLCGVISICEDGQLRQATASDVESWPLQAKMKVMEEVIHFLKSQLVITKITCCHCGRDDLNGAMQIGQNKDTKVNIGDFGVCGSCGNMFCVLPGGATRPMTPEESAKVPSNIRTDMEKLREETHRTGSIVSSPATPEGALTPEDHLRNAKACETMAEECYQRGDVMAARNYFNSKEHHERTASAVAGKN